MCVFFICHNFNSSPTRLNVKWSSQTLIYHSSFFEDGCYPLKDIDTQCQQLCADPNEGFDAMEPCCPA